MSKPRPNHGDPAKREARKRARRASRANPGALPRNPKPTAQLDHASNPRGTRNRREGEEWLGRQPEPEVDDYPGDES